MSLFSLSSRFSTITSKKPFFFQTAGTFWICWKNFIPFLFAWENLRKFSDIKHLNDGKKIFLYSIYSFWFWKQSEYTPKVHISKFKSEEHRRLLFLLIMLLTPHWKCLYAIAATSMKKCALSTIHWKLKSYTKKNSKYCIEFSGGACSRKVYLANDNITENLNEFSDWVEKLARTQKYHHRNENLFLLFHFFRIFFEQYKLIGCNKHRHYEYTQRDYDRELFWHKKLFDIKHELLMTNEKLFFAFCIEKTKSCAGKNHFLECICW